MCSTGSIRGATTEQSRSVCARLGTVAALRLAESKVPWFVIADDLPQTRSEDEPGTVDYKDAVKQRDGSTSEDS